MTFLRKKGEKTRPPVRIEDIDFHAPENQHFFMTREQKEKEQKMKWLKNLERIARKERPGACPYCKSKNTDYALCIDDDKSLMGHGAIWCNDCKKAFHISRIKVDSKYIKEIPKDLSYE